MAEPKTKSQEITKPQLRKLFAMAKQMGMDKEDLSGLVFNLTGSDSISSMTKAQASRLIDYLVDRSRGDYRPTAASQAQLYKIRTLLDELGWGNDIKRLRGFIKRTAGVENERWLDAAGAWKVIEGLKKILQRQKKGDVQPEHNK